MDTNLTVCLELTYEHAHKTYTTCVDYCPSNGHISLLSICYLVGIRDLGFKRS